MADNFSDYVEHPRYGYAPFITGLNPVSDSKGTVWPHWHSPKQCRIPNTAITANTELHNTGLGHVTHYFDVDRECVDCGRRFLFFAREQQYWYETLRFSLSANCIRCTDCRKSERDLKSLRYQYEKILHQAVRSEKQQLKLAEYAIMLVERADAGQRLVELARCCLNRIPDDSRICKQATFRNLHSRSKTLLDATAR